MSAPAPGRPWLQTGPGFQVGGGGWGCRHRCQPRRQRIFFLMVHSNQRPGRGSGDVCSRPAPLNWAPRGSGWRRALPAHSGQAGALGRGPRTTRRTRSAVPLTVRELAQGTGRAREGEDSASMYPRKLWGSSTPTPWGRLGGRDTSHGGSSQQMAKSGSRMTGLALTLHNDSVRAEAQIPDHSGPPCPCDSAPGLPAPRHSQWDPTAGKGAPSEKPNNAVFFSPHLTPAKRHQNANWKLLA